MGFMNDPKEELLKARWRGLKRRQAAPSWAEFNEGSRFCPSFMTAYECWVKADREPRFIPCLLKATGLVRDWVWGTKRDVRRISGLRTRKNKVEDRLRGVLARGSKEKPYVAYIRKDGKQILLAKFATAEEAARCYDRHARAVFGEAAQLNFP